MSVLTSSHYEPSKVEYLSSPIQGITVPEKVSMSDIRSQCIESNVASVIGANWKSALANIIHLVPAKSIEGAVSGFLQNRSTSLAKVMRYSQIARAGSVVSAHVHSHTTFFTYLRQHMSGQRPMYCDAK